MRTYEEARTLCMDCDEPATHTLTFGAFTFTPDLYCAKHLAQATPEFDDVEYRITEMVK